MKSAKDLSVIIVNYNGAKWLKNCLSSLFLETKGLNFEVLVVDNNSSDNSVDLINTHFSAVKLICNKKNVGFAAANNQALKASSGRYIMLLNPDTLLLNNALRQFIKFMDWHSEAGAAGCKLLNKDGSLQFSIRRFPSLLNQLGEALFLHKVFGRVGILSEVVLNPAVYKKVQTVDWVSGAALIVRRTAIDQIGLLDERFFMFSEEVDWCYRLKKAGWQVYYYPKPTIVHYGSSYQTNPALFSQLIKSKLLFFEKHWPKQAFFWRWLTYFNLITRLFIWFTLAKISKAKQAKQRLVAYSYCFNSFKERFS